jgi:ribosome-binding protein aMBF1 (putative translation factor)
MLKCSNCGYEFDANDASIVHDTAFALYCPNCQKGVTKNGDGNERRRQIDERERIAEELEEIAESAAAMELGTGFGHGLEELDEMVGRVHTRIQKEIETRSDD